MRPYDPGRPHVCLDETSVQLIGEKRIPVPMASGQPARIDYEYERHGVCALVMLNEPLCGWLLCAGEREQRSSRPAKQATGRGCFL
jgi:hypothetical protein